MRKLKDKISRHAGLAAPLALAALFVAAVAFAQTTPQWDTKQINLIADKLKCNCGCKQTMACQMQPGCPECKTNKQKMAQMLQSGMDESQILDQFVKEQGKDVLVVPPGVAGVVGPYVALALGLGLVVLVIRKLLQQKPAPVPDVDPAVLAQIDKDLDKLD